MTVLATVQSMSELDFEEVKDYVGRQDLAHRLLEQSVREFAAECDERLASITAERDAMQAKVTQFEILLKGRQGALIAKEEECQRLRQLSRQRPTSVLTITQFAPILIQGVCTPEASVNPNKQWLAVSSGVARFATTSHQPVLGTSSFSHSVDPAVASTRSSEVQTDMISPSTSPANSPVLRGSRNGASPGTVFRRRSVSPDSDSSPAASLPARRARESFASVRTSFGTVRSSVVESVSDDSDASLDELVSQAMRLSRSSFSSSSGRNRLSNSSSVVRGSGPGRASSNSFPRRW